jgi:hypothetical protein
MIPILATPAILHRSKAKALKHRTLFAVCIVIRTAAAEPVAKVLVVSIIRFGFLRVDMALFASRLTQA